MTGTPGGLPWYRQDSDWFTHPKILELATMREGFRAAFVWHASIGYATLHATDGVIRASALPALNGRRADAERLVKVGLWDEHPEGWRVHDFGDRQQSAQVTAQIRTHRQAAARKGNCVRHHGPQCGCWQRPGPQGVVR